MNKDSDGRWKDLGGGWYEIGTCGHGGDEMFIHSKCHIEEPTWVSIIRSEAVAVVRCAVCDEEITRLLLRTETSDAQTS